MYEEFQGKVALVTGGGSGIGQATVFALAKEGVKVAVADIMEKSGEETVAGVRELGGEAFFIKTDISKPDQVENMANRVVERYGRLDYACNNAGTFSMATKLHEQPLDHVEKVIAINLLGVFYSMKYEIPHMLKQGSGAIVNMASAQGVIASPGGASYCAAKHGVVGLTKAAALDYVESGIRINCVCPASVRTPQIEQAFKAQPEVERAAMAALPIGRMSEPEEIAQAVLWLFSGASSYVVGHTMLVDGGKTIA